MEELVQMKSPQPLFDGRSRGLVSLCAAAVLAGACAQTPQAPVTVSTPKPRAVAPATSAASGVAVAPVKTAQTDQNPSGTTPLATDPLHPGEPVDLNKPEAQTDLWARVRKGFGMPDLSSELVSDHEQWYAQRPEYVQRMTERGGRYLFHIVEELERRKMPYELALLPFIESAFNPQARSSARASGMWQFIPSTGRDYDLTQNIFRDDRRDVLASTRAALDYLQKLHTQFGDWHLALAAYNWGEGNVARAVARNQAAGLPADYASLRMPRETQSYVPKLQAVKNIVLKPQQFGLTLPLLANHPYFVSVPIERDIDVELTAQLSGVSLDEFRALNPQLNKPVILAAGTPQVLLPYDNASQFTQNLPKHRGPLASWTAWVAPRTMRVAQAASQVGMDATDLREINHIPLRMLVKAGSTLLVERSDQREADVSEHVADNATMALTPDVPPIRKVTIRAGRRDSVLAIARRYRFSPYSVAHWNRMSTRSVFKRGQTVVFWIPQNHKLQPLALPAVRTAARPVVVSCTRRARHCQTKLVQKAAAPKVASSYKSSSTRPSRLAKATLAKPSKLRAKAAPKMAQKSTAKSNKRSVRLAKH
jgi:membrane-bound lytic murein transglycosylase D